MVTLKYADITERVIGSAFEVHKFLGNGFQEVIYQRALAYEMQQVGLSFAREISQDIFYKDRTYALTKIVRYVSMLVQPSDFLQ
jgi:GxxExxY protein